MKLRSIIFLFLAAFSSFGNEYFCNEPLDSFPVRTGGRIKPLFVHAEEVLNYMTGSKAPLEDRSSVETYCLLSLQFLGTTQSLALHLPVYHGQLKEFLGMGDEEGSLPAQDVLEEIDSLQMELVRHKKGDSYKKSLEKLINQTRLFKSIIEGQNWPLPVTNNQEIQWIPIVSLFPIPKDFTSIKSLQDKYHHAGGESVQLELVMRKMNLPLVALILSLLSLGAFILTQHFLFPLVLGSLSLLVQMALLILRVLISGRAPITNMYETVLFSGFAALALSLFLGWMKRESIFLFAGISYNIMTLMMMIFATGMLSDAISPLVPVLRDNFWLSTHVTTVILSYGAFALSWILANTALIQRRWGNWKKGQELRFSERIYTCLKYGITLLAAGVILGGIWADYSWGRFWGWDPKETWSLIVLFLYTAILHGRYTQWIRPHRFIALTALAFLSVMMAWFGVNYILATGLHSYGFSEGGAIFLGLFTFAQLLILALTFQRRFL